MSGLIERIRADREAGTPGPWQVSGVRSTREIHGHQIDGKDLAGVAVVTYSDATTEEHRGSLSDGRRIARVPEMESRILADAEALKAADEMAIEYSSLIEQVDELQEFNLDPDREALTAYRKARGGE